VLVFVLPPSYEELRRRLVGRSGDGEEVRSRLRTAAREIEEIADFDYVVVNDDLGRAEEALLDIVAAVRCRRERQMPRVAGILEEIRRNRDSEEE
jgi:guanylate kinase